MTDLVSAHRELRLLRPQIRKMWPDPIESLEFVRTVRGETFTADDESLLKGVAPDTDDDLAIVVNGETCGFVME